MSARWMPAVGRGIALLGFLFLLGAGLVLFCGGLTLVAATERE